MLHLIYIHVYIVVSSIGLVWGTVWVTCKLNRVGRGKRGGGGGMEGGGGGRR